MPVEAPPLADLAAFRAMASMDALAAFLGVSRKRLAYHLYSGSRPAYRRFTIPKASGGSRNIASPPGMIRAFQQRLFPCLASLARPKPGCHGFTPDRSIRTNADEHVGKRWVFNLDLLDFFPTIHFGRVRGMFQKQPFNFDASVASVLAQIVCHDRSLPQGAATSPVISNLICRGLDRDLLRLARTNHCAYSRYCDDITLSTNSAEPPNELIDLSTPEVSPGPVLTRLLTQHGFQVNPTKTRLRKYSDRQDVTGLIVNKKVNVKRDFVRRIRSILHDCEARGVAAANARFQAEPTRRPRRRSPPSLAKHLVGQLAFLRMVRGKEDPVYLGLAIRTARTLRPHGRISDVVICGEAATTYRFLKETTWILLGLDGAGHPAAQGTAFTLAGIGIVSALHVIADKPPLSWELRPSLAPAESYPVTEVQSVAGCDMIILHTAARGVAGLRVSEVGAEVGASVTFAGYPQWSSEKDVLFVAPGRITQLKSGGSYDYILTSAQIREGGSGGPVLDQAGSVLGVAVHNGTSPIAPDGALSIRHLDAVKRAPKSPL